MKACFMGLGYIGLPTAIIAAKHGIDVVGVDINPKVVEVTNQGKLHIIEPGMEVKLVKEPDNEFDKEAIKVEMEGLSKIGYVANSPYTVVGDSVSAGRLYDQIGEVAYGVVKFVLPQGVVCEIVEEDA